MTIESLNIGDSKTVEWKGKNIKTGIFKYPVSAPLYLGTEDVENDHVIDRKYHGGIDKACYAYCADAYTFWKEQYPENKFPIGFFGENLTISKLDESKLRIGDRFKVGEALIEISQPRQPCFKLGIRFGSQKILKPFINNPYPGIYFRVIEQGLVSKGDQLELLETNLSEPTVLEVYRLIYGLETSPNLIQAALTSKKLAEAAKAAIQKQINLKI